MKSILEYAIVSLGFVAVAALVIAIGTAIQYYFWNFILYAFNTGIELSWLQAFAVMLVIMFVKKLIIRNVSSK